MSNDADIVPLRGGKPEDMQAADWLAKLDRGGLTSEEQTAFSQWLAQDPRNKHAIRDIWAMWYGLNEPLSHLSPAHTRAHRRASGFVWAAAASVVFAVIVAAQFLFAPAEVDGYYATRIGETRAVPLVDGSEIKLNTNTIVEQSYSEDVRIVRLLSGEAIFDVAHDEARPFVVYAASGMIRAVGTRFAVRVKDDKVSVTVMDGKVAVEQRTDESAALTSAPAVKTVPLMVGKGEAAQIDQQAQAVKETVRARDIDERVSWEQGKLVFHNREVWRVLDEVARYTTVRIEIADARLKDKRITGMLQIGDIDLMLEGMEAALGLKADWVAPNLVQLRS